MDHTTRVLCWDKHSQHLGKGLREEPNSRKNGMSETFKRQVLRDHLAVHSKEILHSVNTLLSKAMEV